MATYILGTDDVDDVRRFGEEVAPAGARPRGHRARAARRGARRSERAAGCRAVASRASSAPAPERDESRRARPPLPQRRSGAPAPVVTPTPDDGTRLTGILPWDEASRPTYPVRPDPAEQAAYGPAQLAVPRHLKDVHDHLRAELTQVRDVVEQVVRGHLAVGCGALGRQRDDDAPEQLDARRLLRVVLPDRHRAPRPRGHRHLPAPARRATPTRCPSSTGSRRSTR